MSNRVLPLVAALAVAAMASGAMARTAAPTQEDVRYAAELTKCGNLADGERIPCEDGVRSRINADWKSRIETQARQRTSK